MFSLGYSLSRVRSVFIFLAFLIVFVGLIIGSFSGYILCLIQQSLSFIKLETPNGVIAYPVQIDVFDIFIVMSLILSIGLIISLIVTRIVFSQKIISYSNFSTISFKVFLISKYELWQTNFFL